MRPWRGSPVVQTFKPVLLHVAANPGGRCALAGVGIARCAYSSLTRRRGGMDIAGVSDRISWWHAWPEHMPSCEKPGEQPRHHFVSEVERFLGRRFLGPWECGHMHASGSSATTGNFEGEEARPWPIRPSCGPWAVGRGPWAVGRRPWAVGRGPSAVGRGRAIGSFQVISERSHSGTNVLPCTSGGASFLTFGYPPVLNRLYTAVGKREVETCALGGSSTAGPPAA